VTGELPHHVTGGLPHHVTGELPHHMDTEESPRNDTGEEAPAWLDEIDHTGDVGIVVRAPQLTTLFERAAWGMFGIVTDLGAVRPVESRTIELEGSDRADLLVRWLSELNYLHLTERILFCRFEIQILRDEHLNATVLGERIDPERHTVYTEIKAVTYHGLEIRESDGEWRAQIIFDL